MFKPNLKKRIDIQMLPMIDVIFFLLIFFMLFTTFKTTPTGLDINLPQAKTVTEQEEDMQVTITIDQAENLFIDKEAVNLNILETKAAKLISKSSDTLFIIKADEQVKYQKIVMVMDSVRKAGGYRLALAADREKLN